MKIIIDAYQFSSSITGTDRLAFNYLVQLQKIDDGNKYYILCSHETYTKSALYSKNFKIISPPRFIARNRYLAYIWRRLTKIRLLTVRADVYFSFHNLQLPGRRLAKKMVASNLDIIPIVLDGYTFNKNRQEIEEEYKRVISLADKIVSISHFSKRELCQKLNTDKEKVEVIHLAADPFFSKYQISSEKQDFFLTIGGSEPRKNTQLVAESYAKLPAKLRREYPLYIAGGKWHGKDLNSLKLVPEIKILGFVSDKKLRELYNSCSAFIFASTYEGFGFTILEAMASGALVINAQGSSLDEVAGSATLSFSLTTGKSEEELNTLLKKVIANKNIGTSFSKKSADQLAKFSWEKSAVKLHKILTSSMI